MLSSRKKTNFSNGKVLIRGCKMSNEFPRKAQTQSEHVAISLLRFHTKFLWLESESCFLRDENGPTAQLLLVSLLCSNFKSVLLGARLVVRFFCAHHEGELCCDSPTEATSLCFMCMQMKHKILCANTAARTRRRRAANTQVFCLPPKDRARREPLCAR